VCGNAPVEEDSLPHLELINNSPIMVVVMSCCVKMQPCPFFKASGWADRQVRRIQLCRHLSSNVTINHQAKAMYACLQKSARYSLMSR